MGYDLTHTLLCIDELINCLSSFHALKSKYACYSERCERAPFEPVSKRKATTRKEASAISKQPRSLSVGTTLQEDISCLLLFFVLVSTPFIASLFKHQRPGVTYG